MPNVAWHRPLSRGAGWTALVLWSILGAAACETASSTATGLGAPIVRTARGDPVQASSPPGVEVTLGGKRVLPAGEMRTD
jgi:hypothetical protein